MTETFAGPHRHAVFRLHKSDCGMSLYFAEAKLAGLYPVSVPGLGVALRMTAHKLLRRARNRPDGVPVRCPTTDLTDHVVHDSSGCAP